MIKKVHLKRSTYTSARISSQRSRLYGKDKIVELADFNFDELIRYLEEHGFRSSVDKSYLQYQGFYLIERILNDHLSVIYKKVFSANNKQNKEFLETYYLKYQIHNMMAVVRCKISKEEDIESFLIGDERRKSKYVKAFEMPNVEDALVYMSKKLGFNDNIVLDAYNKGLYELENYLYKVYYEKISSIKFIYNKKDEKNFFNFIRTYIDLLNARSFLKLKTEEINVDFQEMFIPGGYLGKDYFSNLKDNSVEDCLFEFNKEFGNMDLDLETACLSCIDRRINLHKEESQNLFRKTIFGSPFFAIKYLFDVENEMRLLRILLKAKYLNMSKEETLKLIS